MLDRAIDLAQTDLSLGPFDQAILAAISAVQRNFRSQGETELCFCVTDADLQPWDKRGNAKQVLTRLYDEALVWVYGDFGMNAPERPDDWPDLNATA